MLSLGAEIFHGRNPTIVFMTTTIRYVMCKSAATLLSLVFLLGAQQQPQGGNPGGVEGASNALPHAEQSSIMVRENVRPLPVQPTNQEQHFTSDSVTGQDADARGNHLIAIWRSPSSTAEERVDAVMKLIPRGSSLDSVKKLLGNDGVLAHYFGPSMSLIQNTNGESSVRSGTHDFWQMEYRTPTGKVALRFRRNLTGDVRS